MLINKTKDSLDKLRNANTGYAITIWKDGAYKIWQSLDAKYAEKDSDWLCTISSEEINKQIKASEEK